MYHKYNQPQVLGTSLETPLHHAQRLGTLYELKNLYFKLESLNINGTYKDRAAMFIINDAVMKNYKSITVASCGNLGTAIAYFSMKLGIKCRLFIPEHYTFMKKTSNTNSLLTVEYVKGTYETAVEMSANFAKENNYYDANPSSEAGIIAMQGYARIVNELRNQVRNVDSVWIAVGNGTGLAGIYKQFRHFPNVPSMHAVSSRGNNAVIESVHAGKVIDLQPDSLIETDVNEPLLNWRSYQAKEALEAVTSSGGSAIGVSDDEMLNSMHALEKYEGILTRPASASAWAGLLKEIHTIDHSKTHVIILTS